MKLTPNAELLIDDSTDPRTREVAVRGGFTSPDQYHLFTKPRTDKGKATTWRDVLAPHCEPLALQATQPGKAWLALRFYFLEVHVKCHINGSKLDKPETIALLLPVSFDPEAAVVDPPASGSLPAPVQMHHMLNLWALAYRGKSNSPVKLEYQEDDQGDLQVGL